MIAVTDHNTITGGIETFRLCKEEKLDVAVIVGSEIKTNMGDVIGLFLSQEITSSDIFEVIDEIRRQDGLVLVPHPFKGHKFEELRNILEQIDMVEALNSRSFTTFKQTCLLKTLNKSLVGCSDAHFPQEIGLCRSIINSDFLSVEEMKHLLTDPSNVKATGLFGNKLLQSFSHVVKVLKTRSY